MKKHLRFLLTMLLLSVVSVGWAQDTWIKTAPSNLQTGDIVVIVDETSSCAMSNNNGTSTAPKATAITLSSDKSELATAPASTLQWEVTVTGSSYQFTVAGGTNKLYCTATNNGVRVGTNANNSFTITTGGDNNADFLVNTATSRYIGVYNSQDWRCYTTINNNIKGTVTSFYKKSGSSSDKENATVAIGAEELNVGGSTTVTTDGPALTLTSSNTNVASVSGTTVNALAAGYATINATWAEDDTYTGGSKDFAITVKDANKGTESNPYTVAEALALIDNLGTESSWDVYVKGIVVGDPVINTTQYYNATYQIADDASGEKLEVYRGKYLNNADFTDASQLMNGDEVVVFGKLKYYNNRTKEFDQGNYIVSLNRQNAKEAAGLAHEVANPTKYTTDEAFTNPLTNPNNLTITYTSSDTNVATVDANGQVTVGAAGTTTITATSEEDDTYYAGTASYTLTVKEQQQQEEGVLFNETFNSLENTGGRDGSYSGNVGSGPMNTANFDEEGWTWSSSGSGAASQCVKLGTGSGQGHITTRSIALNGNGTLTFSVAGWGDTKTNTITVTATGGTLSGETQVTATNGTWTTHSVNITEATGNLVLTFTMQRGFIDDIKVVEGESQQGKTDVHTIMATTSPSWKTIPVVGAEVSQPSFTLTQGSPAYINVNADNGRWGKYVNDRWTQISLTDTFEAGETYAFSMQVRIDDTYAQTHQLAEDVTFTVDGEEWERENLVVMDEYSFAMFISPKITVSETPQPGGNYVYRKVNNNSELTNGQYLIVYEGGNVAFDGSLTTMDVVKNSISVSISNEKIAATPEVDASSFTINVSDKSILSASGLYIGHTGSSNGLKTSSTSDFTNTISIDSEHDATITCNNKYMAFNSTSGQERFRYMGNTTGNNKPVQLYKKVESDTPIEPTEPEVTVPTEDVTLTVGQTIDNPVTYPSDLTTITYTSNNPEVATVDAEGKVTGVSVGNTTITGEWTATDNYTATTSPKTYNVVVNEAVEPTTYYLVTDMKQIAAGNEYILVGTENNVVMGAQSGTFRSAIDGITIEGDSIKITTEPVAVLTLDGSKNAWTFQAADNSMYLSWTSSNTLNGTQDNTADAAKWFITDNFQVQHSTDGARFIQYNSSSPRFATYAGTQKAVYLFVKKGYTEATVEDVTLNVSALGYATMYYSDRNLVVPAGAKASTYMVSNGTLEESWYYSAGEVIPAGTAVVVELETKGTAQQITFTVTDANGDTDPDNMLYGSDEEVTDEEQGYNYYILSTPKEDPNGAVGFYWQQGSEGKKVTSAGHKAYLKVPADVAAGAKGFTFGGATTGINTINDNTNDNAKGNWYTIDGQRLNTVPTQKGIYIHNGKKVVVK